MPAKYLKFAAAFRAPSEWRPNWPSEWCVVGAKLGRSWARAGSKRASERAGKRGDSAAVANELGPTNGLQICVLKLMLGQRASFALHCESSPLLVACGPNAGQRASCTKLPLRFLAAEVCRWRHIINLPACSLANGRLCATSPLLGRTGWPTLRS